MTDNRKMPLYKISLKAKEGKERVPLFTVWQGKYGMDVSPEKPWKDRPGIASVTMTDGTVYTLAEWWINMDPPRPPQDKLAEHGRPDKDDTEPPF